ncbi:Similar to Zinc finger protein 76; acc. no. Q8BMU0 [Pyronema omphalodes CBS 100304]|uniref:Similar to Zinc finger protein 76 acc. no. Q8BMU0 n=1 Tax=Pyronema omphalodes (strain CBS 100304) TaxID=1076935 RepID=U4L994_PYROM|nr:Similar to Zinc finger protein 76; acc. no. Q8BMU0 [Pyronema omphalodes CBS 100304]
MAYFDTDTPQPISRTLAAIKKLQADFDDFHSWMKSANEALSLIPAPIPKAVVLYNVPTPPVPDSVKEKDPVSHEPASSPYVSQYLCPPPPIWKGGVNQNGLLTDHEHPYDDPDLRIQSSPVIMDLSDSTTASSPLLFPTRVRKLTTGLHLDTPYLLSKPLQCPFCPGLWFHTSTGYRSHQSISHPIRQQFHSLLEPEPPVQPSEPSEAAEPVTPAPPQPTPPPQPADFTPPPPLTCPHCGRVYKIHQSYRNHNINVHGDKQPFKCGLEGCVMAFSTKGGLDLHMVMVHTQELKFDGESNTWKCWDCGRGYKRERMLRLHVRMVHGVVQEGEK